MYRGYYLVSNGLLAQQRILDVVSNNMANISTAGFKGDTTIPTTFDERLIQIRNRKNETGTIQYRTIDYQNTALTAGQREYTDRRLDVCLSGNVFFNIQPYVEQLHGAGEEDQPTSYLTRAGQFELDSEGYLALANSGRVLDAAGEPILLGTSDITIDETGLITTADGQNFQLGLTYVAQNEDVVKQGDNLFTAVNSVPANQMPEGETYQVIQGAYERSNVNLSEEMTKGMAASRLFGNLAQALKAMDAINQKAAASLAKKM